MQALAPRSRSSRFQIGNALVPGGVLITLVGVVGDLTIHTFNPEAHAHEPPFLLGSGNNPWHLVLFAGIIVTAVGGIRWANRLGSDSGHVLAAAMTLLLGSTVILGAWSGWKASGRSPGGDGQVASGDPHAAAPGTDTHIAATGAQGEGESLFGGHSHGAPGRTTDQQFRMMERQLDVAEAASAEYRDIGAARSDGYVQVTQFIPGLGLHMANLTIPDDVFDPARPQVMLYVPNANGGLTLAGVAYTIAHTSDVPPEGFAGGEDVWHFHQNLCFLKDGSVTITITGAGCRSKGGVFQQQTDWLLHAWIWRENPKGVFVEYNDRIF